MTEQKRLAPHTGRGSPPPILLQRGLTLVELMVSLGLGLLLIAAVGSLYLGGSQTFRAGQDSARIQEAGRYALDIIGRSLRRAGYRYLEPTYGAVPGHLANAVQGLNAACPSSAPVTDVITVQYDGMAGEKDCQAEDIDANGQVVQHSFFVHDNGLRCNAVHCDPPGVGSCPDPPPPIPPPECCPVPENAPTPPSTCPGGVGDELLRDAENLKFLYGIDTNADGSANRYTATPGNWAQVVTTRVCVLIRSEHDGIAPPGSTYLNCSGALGTAADDAARFSTAGDTRLRRVFVATFALRNRITAIP